VSSLRHIWQSALCLVVFLPLFSSGTAQADTYSANWQWMNVTSYCLYGTMADGNYVHDGAIAANWDVPFGSLVYIPGYGEYVVEDRGSLITEGHLDIWMPECWQSWNFGRQELQVQIERWGWGSYS
jgi:3D (Asp-Asp-Asp) domain-containing protein